MAFIHQNLALVDTMSVMENIGHVSGFPRRAGLISWSRLRRKSEQTLQTLEADIDPATSVGRLSQAPSRAIARQLAAGLRADYANVLPSALACFEDDFEPCIAHLRLPVTHRRFARTTNLLERLFVEERRRLKIIPNGFGEKPVLKLMFGALIRAAERWRGLRSTEFELRQIAAVRKELDQEYQASITPLARSSQPQASSKSSP